MGGRGIVALALSAALGGCSTGSPSSMPPELSEPSGLLDATTLTGPPIDAALVGSDVCSPPLPTPQQFPGEVLSVLQVCGSPDGGQPPLVGAVPGSTTIGFDIGLPVRNMALFDQLTMEASDPTSPNYGHFLTTAEYMADFAASTCDFDAVLAWANAKGFTVTMTYPDRTQVDLSAPVSLVNAAFNVTLDFYLRPDGTQFFAPDVDPSIDLAVPVFAPEGLDDCFIPMPGAGGDP